MYSPQILPPWHKLPLPVSAILSHTCTSATCTGILLLATILYLLAERGLYERIYIERAEDDLALEQLPPWLGSGSPDDRGEQLGTSLIRGPCSGIGANQTNSVSLSIALTVTSYFEYSV